MVNDLEMTEEEFEQRQAWTECAGKVSMAEVIEQMILSQAANFFRLRKDEKANLLRDLASIVNKDYLAPEKKKLDVFIEQSMKGGKQ